MRPRNASSLHERWTRPAHDSPRGAAAAARSLVGPRPRGGPRGRRRSTSGFRINARPRPPGGGGTAPRVRRDGGRSRRRRDGLGLGGGAPRRAGVRVGGLAKIGPKRVRRRRARVEGRGHCRSGPWGAPRTAASADGRRAVEGRESARWSVTNGPKTRFWHFSARRAGRSGWAGSQVRERVEGGLSAARGGGNGPRAFVSRLLEGC